MRLLTVSGILASVLLTASVEAADQIRVLLAQEALQIVLSAERSVMVRLPGGEERRVATPLVIAPVAGAVRLNGEWFPSDLTVRGLEGDLTLTITDRQNGGQRPDRPADMLPAPRSLAVGGAVRILSRDQRLAVINEVELDEYVKGVVPSEMSSAWHPEALKVQAVVARTYALYQRLMNRGREYDLVASTQDQVYRGRHGLDARVQQAVADTRGLVLTYRNAPILAAFSSTAAGPTEDAMNVWSKDLPYLKGVDCPFDANSPYYRWRTAFKVEDLERGLRQQGVPVGTIATVTPFSHSRAGRVTRIRVLHSNGELILRGEDLRRVIGYTVIPSTQFEIESVGREIVLSGRGAGHAVGLCQWGAKELAGLGYPFTTILHYYFPGTELKDTRSVEMSSHPTP